MLSKTAFVRKRGTFFILQVNKRVGNFSGLSI